MVTGIVEAHLEDAAPTPSPKQDKGLNRALGKLFAAAAEGPIPLDKTLVNAMNKIKETKRWDSAAKCAMYDTIIDHVAPEDRHVVSRAVFEDTNDVMVTRRMAARVFGDIELLDDTARFREAAFVLERGVAIPSKEVAQRIVNYADALPPVEQFDALEELFPHTHPYGELVHEKMLSAIPHQHAPKRYELAMMVADATDNDALAERALRDALGYVDETPVKERTKNAAEVAFTSFNPDLVSDAVDVAIQHATVANKFTIKALENLLDAIVDGYEKYQRSYFTQEQVMGIEIALNRLVETPPEKPAPMDPSQFVVRMWATPAP